MGYKAKFVLTCFHFKESECVAASARESGRGLCRLAFDKDDMVLVGRRRYSTYVRIADGNPHESTTIPAITQNTFSSVIPGVILRPSQAVREIRPIDQRQCIDMCFAVRQFV